MDIASLREKIVIEKNEAVVDENSNHLNRWEEYYSCRANAGASPYKQKESEKAGVTIDTNALIFEVRCCSELADIDATHYRVRFRGETYNITNIDMMNFDHKQIRISCDRERKDAGV